MDPTTGTLLLGVLVLLVNGAGAIWNSSRYTMIVSRLTRIETLLKINGRDNR